MPVNIEAEKEPLLLEVPEKVLARYGWEYYQRIDGHVFTVLARQGANLNKAFRDPYGLYARHQMKDSRGELLPKQHIDLLKKSKIQDAEIMVTVYDPETGCPNFTVLEKATKK